MSASWFWMIIAEGGAGQQGGGQGSGGFQHLLIMMVLMFGVFYLIVIGPQRKRERQRREMIANVRKNDQVVTSGGILGTVMNVRERDVVLKVDDNTRIKILKSAIVDVSGDEDRKGTGQEDGRDPGSSRR